MNQNQLVYINNSPAGASDLLVSNGVINLTGLDPFSQGNLNYLQIRRNRAATNSVWTGTLTAGVQNTLSFTMTQTVNNIPCTRVFTFPNTTATVAADITAALNTFFGGAATSAGGYVASTAPQMQVQYEFTVSSLVVTLDIAGVTANPIVNVTGGQNVTMTNGCAVTLSSQANTDGVAILFKVANTSAFWLANTIQNGSMVTVGTLTGQTAANNATWRVKYVSTTTFNLVDPVTLVAALASGTGTAVGTVTFIAQPDFGSATYVQNDANNNSFVLPAQAQVTATTYNFSLVTIGAGYNNLANSPEVQPTVSPIHYWIPECLIASPYTVNTNGQALTAALETYITA